MKNHLLLLAQVPDIDLILALRSLFPWEGAFNEGEPDRLRTLPVDGESDKREMFAAGAHEPMLWATTHGDNIEINLDATATPPQELHHLIAAMGLQETGGPSSKICFRSVDVECLHDRILELDNAWVLIRKLKLFEADPEKIQHAAETILQFAQRWTMNCARMVNSSGTPGQDRRTLALETEARAFADWKVSSLQSITLHYDPRGSALSLQFDGEHPMEVCALKMDWPVGQPLKPCTSRPKTKAGKYDVRPTRIAHDVQGVLNGLVVHNCQVKIAQRLSPRLYAKVNELLITLGGKWMTSQQAHVFADDPTPLLDALIDSGEVYTAKDYECFFTPPALIQLVIAEAKIEPGMEVMEPNAGGGALAMAAAEIVGKSKVTCYELMPQNVKTLVGLGFQLDGPQDFLSVEPKPAFDRVIMNPPFSGFRDIAHIRHAMGFLRPGGVLTAIASTQWQTHDTAPAKAFQAYVALLGGVVKQIPAGAFKSSGTDVATTLLVLKKPLVKVKPPMTRHVVALQEQAALF